MGGIESVIVGADDTAGGRIVEEPAVGVIIVADEDGFDCLCEV